MRLLWILALVAPLAVAGLAEAQNGDPLDQPVQGESHPLPDGVPSISPDSLVTGSESPDANQAEAVSPDSLVTGAGRPIQAHAVSPDSITTGSEDLSDLPSASVIDQAPASIAPAPPRAECAQASGDAGWSACLAATAARLDRSRSRLDAAEAAYSRSLTMHAPTGEARLAIIEERDAAQAEVGDARGTLTAELAQAEQAGVSSWVTAPYAPAQQGW